MIQIVHFHLACMVGIDINTKAYETTRCVGMSHNTKDLLKLFCMLNGTSSNLVINSLLRQWYFSSLEQLETDYPDKIDDWQGIRELLHN